MKKLLPTLLALVLHSCAGGSLPLPAAEPQVRRALPVDAPYTLTLSEADVRATVAHMQALAKDQQGQLDAARQELASEHTAHLAADRQVQATIKAAQADHSAQRWELFKTRLLGFPVTFALGVAGGIALCVLTKVGAAAGGLAVKWGLKATTGV